MRRRIVETLCFAIEMGRKVGRIRDLFEAELKKRPLTTWSPTLSDLRRRELYGYERCNLEGEFKVSMPQDNARSFAAGEEYGGRYDLTVGSDGTDLPESQLWIDMALDGGDHFEYVLPPVASIRRYDQSDLNELLVKINYLEALLKLIGLLPDEEA